MRVTVRPGDVAKPQSIGLVCTCGKTVVTPIEGTVVSCECGAVWLISAMLLAEGRAS